MVSQGRPEDSADQSQGLRWRNTDDVVRFELEGTNYQVCAAFVGYAEPVGERTSAFWRACFDNVMENERWLGWNVQLCAKPCPQLLPLKLEFSNCSMFSALTMSINYCSWTWSSYGAVEKVKGCCDGGARLQTKSTQSFLFLAK